MDVALQARRGAGSPASEAPGTTAVQDVVVSKRALEVDAHRASICMSVEGTCKVEFGVCELSSGTQGARCRCVCLGPL